MKTAQISIEFLILTGFLLTSFVIFFLVIQENLSDKISQRIDAEILEIAKTIRLEIELAYSSSDGYTRHFTIPKAIYSGEYRVNLTNEFVFVESIDKSHIVSLSVKNNTGQVIIGENTIKKENGIVKINQ